MTAQIAVFTDAQILAAAETVVDRAGPDTAWPAGMTPLYVVGRASGVPARGCLIGHIHSELAGEFPPEDCEGQSVDVEPDWPDSVRAAAYWRRFYTRRQRRCLGVAQAVQDNLDTWGEALGALGSALAEDPA